MIATRELTSGTQRTLLRELLRNRDGVTVDALTRALDISRNAVRQHITSLERDGLVARGKTQPSGGRPQQLYVLTSEGEELFPRQYSWFSEMLLQMLRGESGSAGLEQKLAEMGRAVAGSLQARLAREGDLNARIAAIADILQELGYDAAAKERDGELQIEAHNCVFHKLASQHPEVCSFDLALLSSCSDSEVEHSSCMVRGSDACRFRFLARGRPLPADGGSAPGD
ncbi:MAG TPA: helix-turn-helix domain-containing protein [Xanthobacteraceae bacterium]|jgi:predicted ArsR family transcriptional regulator